VAVRATLNELEERFTAIQWRVPVSVTVGARSRLCCRICIANFGLKAAELETVAYCFDDEAGFIEHLKSQHREDYH
jgi:hypothetical protein